MTSISRRWERWTPFILSTFLALFGGWTLFAYVTPGSIASRDPSPAARAGKTLWLKHNCQACHQIYGLGGYLGPDLTNAASRRGRTYLLRLLSEGADVMPRFDLTDADREHLADFLEYVDQTGTFPPASAPLKGFNN